MRKSRIVNLVLVGGGVLAVGACLANGCGGRRQAPPPAGPPDPT